MIAAISAGIVVFLAVGSLVTAVTHNQQASLLPALVAGVWAAWPLLHGHAVQRENFLHPPPREYGATTRAAFGNIRDVLRESAYNFGDKWRVTTADVATGRIFAEIRFFDEEQHAEVSRGHINYRKERVQRYLSLEVQMKDTANGSAIVQFDFTPRVEGTKYGACDWLVDDVLSGVEESLGPGREILKSINAGLPAPPWWLLAMTIGELFLFFQDLYKAAS
jgi:hypothetical protein